MKAKLIKVNDNQPDGGFYILRDLNGDPIALEGNLSLKNCQAIELGYDLDELAENHWDENNRHFKDGINPYAHRFGFKAGFQKALELMGDKKFSEEDVDKAVEWGITNGRLGDVTHYGIDNFIRSLQQTEWEVEILMEEVSIGDKYSPDPKPILDADGCLILKLKSE